MAVSLWIAAFTLPSIYLKCQPTLDGMVHTMLSYLLAALQGGETHQIEISARSTFPEHSLHKRYDGDL